MPVEQADLKLVNYAISRLSRNGNRNYADRDDLYSDGMLGLAKGVEQWDASAEIRHRFKDRDAYLRTVVTRFIIDGMRTRNGRAHLGFRKQEFERTMWRLDQTVDEGENDESMLDRYVGREDEHLFVASDLLKDLPERERLVMWKHDVLGERLHEIAEELGVTESRVSQIRTRAIERLRGERPMQEEQQHQVQRTATVDYRLTNREIEVIAQVAEGHNNRTIGELLLLSEETVKSHVRHVLSKMNARSRSHAVALAFRAGLVA